MASPCTLYMSLIAACAFGTSAALSFLQIADKHLAASHTTEFLSLVPLENGYTHAQRKKDDAIMTVFINSVIKAHGGTVMQKGFVEGLAPWHSGTTANSTFEHLLEGLNNASSKFIQNFHMKSPVLFEDVTPWAFPKEWNDWNHSGFPRSHQGTPTFFDLNKDGVLDYFYHNHYEAVPEKAWDMGVSYGYNKLTEGKSAFWRSVGNQLLKCTEPKDSKWKAEKGMDTHGTAVLDIDRDGLLDIYMAVGGGDGIVGGPAKNAVLMWGEKGEDLQHFVGGRDASEYANAHNKDSRGRFNYFVDFNNDGLLDIVHSNEPRSDEIHAPGLALINNGDRTFTEHKELSEYTEAMLLTDANGDGHADEFIVTRRDCAIKDCHYNGNKECTRLYNVNPDWYDFCVQRPEGTTAIYKWDESKQALVNIAPDASSKEIGADEHAMSMQSGDFDGDGTADLAVLYPTSIKFYYSKGRSGALPIGKPSEERSWDEDSCSGVALRAGDLDLDGKLELLVLCFEVKPGEGPEHRLYTGSAHSWTLQSNKKYLGGLRDDSLVHPPATMMASVCKGDVGSFPGYLRKGCQEYLAGDQGGHYASPRAMGMSLVDWNNDGFLDLALSYDFGKLLLLRNNAKYAMGASAHKYLAVKLVGTISNEYGIGASVLLQVNMGHGEEDAVQLREVSSASHEVDWLGTRDDRIIFGLGRTGTPVSLTVRWPGKGRQEQKIDSSTLKAHMNSMKNLLVITEPMAENLVAVKHGRPEEFYHDEGIPMEDLVAVKHGRPEEFYHDEGIPMEDLVAVKNGRPKESYHDEGIPTEDLVGVKNGRPEEFYHDEGIPMKDLVAVKNGRPEEFYHDEGTPM